MSASNQMPWKSVASRLTEHYLPQVRQTFAAKRNGPQGWRQWAGDMFNDKIRSRSVDVSAGDEERVALFPGWATRRYRKAVGDGQFNEAFEIEVFISGFAYKPRTLESATRAQRAFLRLAKGYASLPKLQSSESEDIPPLTPSTEKLLETVNLPPRPEDISEDYEIEALDSRFRAANEEEETSPVSTSSSAEQSRPSSPSGRLDTLSSLPAPPLTPDAIPAPTASDLRRMHTNLESRLLPFWSRALSARTVRVSLFVSPLESTFHHRDAPLAPLVVRDVVTAADGSFQTRFTVPWEEICQHPAGVQVAFTDRGHEHDLVASSSVLPLAVTPHATLGQTTSIRIPLTYSQVRLISDIDDTVKLSNIPRGARTVFHNVFVKDLKDSVIPGMGEWYTELWKKGIRFHYVSNGPFELLSLVSEFLQISQLPPGSIRLRSYGGRSLFKGLLSAPATRKREGVVSLLAALPDSRFFLVGDTGEQDLELYAAIARDHPKQILGIFVRDAGRGGGLVEDVGRLEDPTGMKWTSLLDVAVDDREGRSSPAVLTKSPASRTAPSRTLSNSPFFTSNDPRPPPPSRKSTQSHLQRDTRPPDPLLDLRRRTLPVSLDSELSNDASLMAVLGMRGEQWVRRQGSTDVEKKRAELQVRVWKARVVVPDSIPLRVFRQPQECTEVEEILDGLRLGT